MIMSKML